MWRRGLVPKYPKTINLNISKRNKRFFVVLFFFFSLLFLPFRRHLETAGHPVPSADVVIILHRSGDSFISVDFGLFKIISTERLSYYSRCIDRTSNDRTVLTRWYCSYIIGFLLFSVSVGKKKNTRPRRQRRVRFSKKPPPFEKITAVIRLLFCVSSATAAVQCEPPDDEFKYKSNLFEYEKKKKECRLLLVSGPLSY